MTTDFDFERSSKRATLESSSDEMTTSKIAIHCQIMARLQSPAIVLTRGPGFDRRFSSFRF
jgi:hypothetical protein